MIRKVLKWLRRLLPDPHPPREAAQPVTSGRIMHLMAPGMRSSCGLQVSPQNWVTVQHEYVSCKTCRAIGRAQRARRISRVR